MSSETVQMPKIAESDNFYITSTSPERDAALVTIAQALGSTYFRIYAQQILLIIFEGKNRSPHVRQFKEYLVKQKIAYTEEIESVADDDWFMDLSEPAEIDFKTSRK